MFPHAEYYSDRTISLPLYPRMTDADADDVVAAVRKVIARLPPVDGVTRHETSAQTRSQTYGLRRGAEEFPLMVVISIIYPCNFGCPNCPYTDANSEIRAVLPPAQRRPVSGRLWNKLAAECGEHGAWMRCTGGGEPMLHPHMVDMIEFAKAKGARVWMNTNGSMFGPTPVLRDQAGARDRAPAST